MSYLPQKNSFRDFAYTYLGQEYVGPPQGSSGTDWLQWGSIGAGLITSIWGRQNGSAYQSGSTLSSGSLESQESKSNELPIWLIILVIACFIALIILQ